MNMDVSTPVSHVKRCMRLTVRAVRGFLLYAIGLLVLSMLVVPGNPTRAAFSGYPSSVGERPDTFSFAPGDFDRLRTLAETHDTVHVIVTLDVPFTPSGNLTSAAAFDQRQRIRTAQQDVVSALRGTGFALKYRYDGVPALAASLSPTAVEALRGHPMVKQISLDLLTKPTLIESVPHIEGDVLHADGQDGSGGMVAVLDTGIDTDHPAFGGRVISEACFSLGEDGTADGNGDCPNGNESQVGPPAGKPLPVGGVPDTHGTHVGGIAAGQATSVPPSPLGDGVARGANIASIMVFSEFTSSPPCPLSPPCALSNLSDQIAALEHVRDNVDASHNVVSVNMSLGGDTVSSPCDGSLPSYKSVIDDLRSRDIATIMASGNAGETDAIAIPACISSSVAVGATAIQDLSGNPVPEQIAPFSNQDPRMVDLVAPGFAIRSAAPNDGSDTLPGTSFSAPHVAGGWVALHQATGMDVGSIEFALIQTGESIVDTRGGANEEYKSIRLAAARTGGSLTGGGGAGAAGGCLIERMVPASWTKIVRRWRDDRLLDSRVGRSLVRMYYGVFGSGEAPGQ